MRVQPLPLLEGNIGEGAGGLQVLSSDSPLNDSRQLECVQPEF